MAETPPVNEKGYVIPATTVAGWWPDRDVVEESNINRQALAFGSTIGREKATNPFLRADDRAIAQALGMAGRLPAEVFAELRERKNKA